MKKNAKESYAAPFVGVLDVNEEGVICIGSETSDVSGNREDYGDPYVQTW